MHGIKCVVLGISIVSSVNGFPVETFATNDIVCLNWNNKPKLGGFLLVFESPGLPYSEHDICKIGINCKCLAYCFMTAADIPYFYSSTIIIMKPEVDIAAKTGKFPLCEINCIPTPFFFPNNLVIVIWVFQVLNELFVILFLLSIGFHLPS